MKTPDEIKRALWHCMYVPSCEGCSYYSSDDCSLGADALTYIQQLEAKLSCAKSNHQHTIDIAEKQKEQIDKLKKVVVRLNAERNASVEELNGLKKCSACNHDGWRSTLIQNMVEGRGVKED